MHLLQSYIKDGMEKTHNEMVLSYFNILSCHCLEGPR